ncbi:MAG TPA: hypothetical protein H9711_06655 [Candidatus Mediterraneibacter intestinavium]|nr:hypothetical protein [Candidatus Mediterraneibacter intestinavium]
MKQKYESDMTPKEKRQAELEKLRGMSLGEKAGYLWTYYKIWLLVPVILIFVIWQGMQIYHNMQEVELLSVGVVDTNLNTEEGQETFESDLLKLLGTGGENEVIALDTGLSSGDDSASAMKRATVLGAGTLDLMICGEELYDSYDAQGAFADWEEILGEDYGKYESYFVDGRLDLSRSAKWDSYGLVIYEPVYAGALVSSENTEALRQFAEYYLSDVQ